MPNTVLLGPGDPMITKTIPAFKLSREKIDLKKKKSQDFVSSERIAFGSFQEGSLVSLRYLVR